MSDVNAWKSGTAALLVLGLATGGLAPVMISTPAIAQATTFPDVSPNYWAYPFIQELAARRIIVGFAEDGTFRPEEPVTRAQFAAMIRRAFNRPPIRNPIQFTDVPSNYWGRAAIEEAYTTGFMAGYPGNTFRPNENIPRAQVLVSLSSGLNYTNRQPIDRVLQVFTDAPAIPTYARPGVAASTERQVVVNYPDVRLLNPNRIATRAEVAAFIYQALVSINQAPRIDSPYIVGAVRPPDVGIRIPAGATIPARYEGSKVVLPRDGNEAVPITLKVAQNIVNSQGTVLIPAGSEVLAVFRNVPGGGQVVTRELILPGGRRVAMNASSEVINNYNVVRRDPTGRIIIGTLVGAGAGAGIAAVTGDRHIQAWEVLTGAAAGALAGAFLRGSGSVEAIALEPNSNLLLTLNSDVILTPRPLP